MITGILLCVVITIASQIANQLPLWPFTLANGRHPFEPVMLAILVGMVIGNVGLQLKSHQAGIRLVMRKVLPLGIILLGAKLNFFDILQVGLSGIVLTLVEVGMALVIMLFLTRWLGLTGKLGTLLAVGTAICGGTAIVAAAPVIEAEEKDVVFSVATVTLLGLVAMVALPVIGHFLMMSEQAFGIWAGLAIHQTPQVIASGFSYGEKAGETATIVKLARVCLLAPIVFFIGLWYARSKPGAATQKISYWKLFPTFVFGFLFMALARSFGLLPVLSVQLARDSLLGVRDWNISVASISQRASEFCIVASMAAVGLETKFKGLRQTGVRPFLAGTITALIIAITLLVLIRTFIPH